MLIVTSSSIPPRFQYLPKFYETLAKQKTRPDKVELWVAKNYRRFPGEVPALPELPDWVEVNWIEDDLGPATKVLPSSRKWRGTDADLLFCDDDRQYDVDWIDRFQRSKEAFPEMALCDCGFTLKHLGLERTEPLPGPAPKKISFAQRKLYRAKRLLSFGLYTPVRPMFGTDGYVDIVEGFGGVLVRPDWFTDADWNIPDVLWTVDDVWLSGCLRSRGIYAHTTIGAITTRSYDASDAASPLATHIEDGLGRMDANRACVQYFREHYGIWM